MSTPPTRRTRKTTDFTDFFRAGHSSARQAQSDTENYFSSSTLDVPGESSSTKKKTKIPFLGRTRKKSTHSTASSHGVPCASRSVRESADVSTRTLSTDQRPNTLREESAAASRLPQVTVKPPPVKSAISLGSKFAAHFTPTKSRKPPPLSVARSSPTPSIHTGGTLSPPFASPRAASFDSGSSGTSQNRSTTPRPAQPSITVSFSPDSVEEYKDLFTLPKNKTPTTSSSIPQALSRSPSTRRPEGNSDATPRSTPPLDPPFRSAESHDSRTSRSQGYPGEEKQLTSSLSRLRQPSNNSSVSKRADHSPLDRSKSMVHRREVGIPGIVRPSATPAQLYATATRTPLPAAELQAASARRTRTVSAVAERRSGPPTMPLPLPPAPDTPPPSPPVSVPPSPQIAFQTPSTANTPKPLLRPRANTISIVSNGQGGLSNGTSEATSRLQSLIKTQPKDFDVHSATPQQLKAALVARNRQYDELSTYLLKVTEAHDAEVASLEKKVYALEKEAARKDKEIKGLTWLVNNHRGPPVSSSASTASRIQSSLESDQESAGASSPSGASSNIRRYQYTDDSGAESHATSGAESPTSGAESLPSLRGKRVKRPFTLGESSYNLYRATMGKRATEAKVSSDQATTTATPNKRSSAASLSPSTASSSSLLPSSPSSTTVSSLSAIPETTLRFSGDTSDKGDLGSRTSSRISTSSTISSSSSNYASNLKRSRPPSIAQVLEKSEKLAVMDEVLELRPPGIA
ncbi:hypothetical protein BDQ17DRAFT_1537663 [Cyathus striatus]|nr:hypothetical protein BDQ17DRAFT_1537663 [Cyathus striatus]